MIVKMKFLSITGPKADIGRVVDEYLSKYEIHLENALTELKTVNDLKPYIETNPYKNALAKSEEFLGLIDTSDVQTTENITIEEALSTINSIDESITALREQRIQLEDEREALKASLRRIEPFRELHYSIKDILHFKFIKFRFGKISHVYFNKFEKYVYQDLDTVFYKCHTDDEYIWGVYFVPKAECHKIDAVYSSMHFERIFLPDEYTGTPEEAYNELKTKISSLTKRITELTNQITAKLETNKEMLYLSGEKIAKQSANFDVRKLAACTREGQEVFYILCGWMSQKDAHSFEKEIVNDEELFCIIEDDHNNVNSSPPTKLNNPRLFKPFEMFIKMYGLPAYNEIDPTIFVAITYAFIFGIMFGDAGQGLCLLIGGFLLYRFKKVTLAAIISCAGFFSTIFGFLFGSFFGFEDVIPAIWLRPISHMTTLPFIGKINTVFIYAISFGMFLILLSMIFHIINAIRAKDIENTWFDNNGLAGLLFYGSFVAIIVLLMNGKGAPAAIVLVIMFVIPLILIALKEPLTRLALKKTDIIPGSKGMFFIQSFFELFEVLLSYFSNTISFVRIGAFAVSHAAMMQVVLMLAGAENGGSPNWIVIIIGNLFVSGMEGLIVAIQVLRLEYYELFCRFYKGSGRAFTPFTAKKSTPKKLINNHK